MASITPISDQSHLTKSKHSLDVYSISNRANSNNQELVFTLEPWSQGRTFIIRKHNSHEN